MCRARPTACRRRQTMEKHSPHVHASLLTKLLIPFSRFRRRGPAAPLSRAGAITAAGLCPVSASNPLPVPVSSHAPLRQGVAGTQHPAGAHRARTVRRAHRHARRHGAGRCSQVRGPTAPPLHPQNGGGAACTEGQRPTGVRIAISPPPEYACGWKN